MDDYFCPISGNEGYGCSERGLAVWGDNRYPFTLKDNVAWHCHVAHADIRKARFATIDGLVIRGDVSAIDGANLSPRGLSCVWYYPPAVMKRIDAQGVFENRTQASSGERGGLYNFDANQMHLEGCVFGGALPLVVQADRHYSMSPGEATGPGRTILRDNRYKLLPGLAGGKSVYTYWGPGTDDVGARNPLLLFHYDHQGIPGNDFEQFWPEQAPEFLMLFDDSSDMAKENNAAEPGLTNAQHYAKYGVSTGGAPPPLTADQTTHSDIEGFTAPIDLTRATPYTTRSRQVDVTAALWGDATGIQGWAQDVIFRDEPIELGVFADGKQIGAVTANEYNDYIHDYGRGRGYSGFSFSLPVSVRDGQEHVITIRPVRDGRISVEVAGTAKDGGLVVKSATDERPPQPPADTDTDERIQQMMDELTADLEQIAATAETQAAATVGAKDKALHLLAVCKTHTEPDTTKAAEAARRIAAAFGVIGKAISEINAIEVPDHDHENPGTQDDQQNAG